LTIYILPLISFDQTFLSKRKVWLLEPLVYWDTTFAIAYIEDTALFHDECRCFADRLERESILSVSSDFVHNEVAFHIFKTALGFFLFLFPLA
jgi:hypothetical protein